MCLGGPTDVSRLDFFGFGGLFVFSYFFACVLSETQNNHLADLRQAR